MACSGTPNYHLIAKDKVAEPTYFKKKSNSNSFSIRNPLLKVAKIAVTHLSVGLSLQNKKKFKGIKFIRTIN